MAVPLGNSYAYIYGHSLHIRKCLISMTYIVLDSFCILLYAQDMFDLFINHFHHLKVPSEFKTIPDIVRHIVYRIQWLLAS